MHSTRPMHLVLVLVAVALCLYLFNTHIPGSRPWIVTFKMIVSAVVTVLALVFALVYAGFAVHDEPLFGPHQGLHEDWPLREHEGRR